MTKILEFIFALFRNKKIKNMLNNNDNAVSLALAETISNKRKLPENNSRATIPNNGTGSGKKRDSKRNSSLQNNNIRKGQTAKK